MASELIMIKERGGLFPRDPHSAELFDALQAGVDLKAVLTQPRNPGQHKLLWSIAKMVSDNHRYYNNPGAVMRMLKLYCGLFEDKPAYHPRTGEPIVLRSEKSISFASMDQGEFNQFFKKAMDCVSEKMLPGIRSDMVYAELVGILHDRK